MSLNRYMYVQGNVVNALDPSGLCPWVEYDALKGLVPQMYDVARRWNRIFLPISQVANILQTMGPLCGIPEILKKTTDTSFSDTAFVAFMAAYIHGEGRFAASVVPFSSGYTFFHAIKDIAGDVAGQLGRRSATYGISNLSADTARDIYAGKIPVNETIPGVTLLDEKGKPYIPLTLGNRLDELKRIASTMNYGPPIHPFVVRTQGSFENSADKMSFLIRNDVSLELLGANMLAGIVRAKSLGLTPTVFNIKTWFGRGIQSPTELKDPAEGPTAVGYGNNTIQDMYEVVSGNCDLGLHWSKYPQGEFKFFDKEDMPNVTASNLALVNRWLNATQVPVP